MQVVRAKELINVMPFIDVAAYYTILHMKLSRAAYNRLPP